jgi:tRNA-Thr(GGU) m(6)t(6)A37 methyltransferase TsaA
MGVLMGLELRPVAWVRSTRDTPRDDGWDAERATIELDGAVPDEALLGLEAFSHVDVLYVLDRADDAPPAPFARHPRGNADWPFTGIFAQRAKDRPNRLGLSTCAVVAVGARRVDVAGLDAIDGTPVVDLKPYVRELGPRGEVHQPRWMDELMSGYFSGRSR